MRLFKSVILPILSGAVIIFLFAFACFHTEQPMEMRPDLQSVPVVKEENRLEEKLDSVNVLLDRIIQKQNSTLLLLGHLNSVPHKY